MTKSTVDATELVRNTLMEHGDVFKELMRHTLTEFMEVEVGRLCGAKYDARSDERVNTRNGYRLRALETRVGSMDLLIPKLRQGSYLPSFLEARRRWEQAFINVVSEAYVLGVSTRKVEELVKAMGAEGMSRSEVSRMAASLDEQVEAFRQRKLDRAYPYLWLDALYIKVREGGRVVSKAALVAYGVSEFGEREVIGTAIADGEMEDAWRSFLGGLVARGLRGVRLVISDAHSGLRKGLRGALNGVSWQRCTVHFMRNVLCRVPKAAQGFVGAALKGIFSQPSQEHARLALKKAVEVLTPKYPAAAAVIEEAAEDVLSYMSFPEKHWKQLHSTNPLERQNREIRRRTDVVGIFPNSASAQRLITMLLVEQNDEWSVGRRYFSLESMQLVMNPLAAADAVPTPALEAAA